MEGMEGWTQHHMRHGMKGSWECDCPPSLPKTACLPSHEPTVRETHTRWFLYSTNIPWAPGQCQASALSQGKKMNNTEALVHLRYHHLPGGSFLSWLISDLSVDTTLNSKSFCLLPGVKGQLLHFPHAHLIFHLPRSKISYRKPWDQS